jgi:predicted acyltransferase
MPAIATALIGVVTSRFLLSDKAPAEKVAWMFVYGTLLTVLGLWWHLVFPLNKSLWTSSYVVYTGGLAIYGLAFCYWIVDVQKSQWWIVPFQAYGINAITAFFGSGLLIKAFIYIKLDLAGESTSLLNYLYQNSFALFLSPYNASLAMAIFWILFFLIPIGWMYHKKIIIKV